LKKYSLALLFILAAQSGFSQAKRISGTVIDDLNGEALIGANVVIQDLFIGASTNLKGEFEILGVPSGSFKLLVKYIGYEDRVLEFESTPEEAVHIRLKSVAIQGEEVVITALARGQLGAINQQINALQIKNVVSAARIQELPDATAAEAIGRLPGISINRIGGEANKV